MAESTVSGRGIGTALTGMSVHLFAQLWQNRVPCRDDGDIRPYHGIIADIDMRIIHAGQDFASLGYREVRLAVDEGNPQSSAFWRKNGFSETG